MRRVAIFLLKHEIELLSLIFSGKEFQMETPSYIKLFFILFVLGFGTRIKLELPRRLWFKMSFLKVNNFFERIRTHVIERFKHHFCFCFFPLLFERFPT